MALRQEFLKEKYIVGKSVPFVQEQTSLLLVFSFSFKFISFNYSIVCCHLTASAFHLIERVDIDRIDVDNFAMVMANSETKILHNSFFSFHLLHFLRILIVEFRYSCSRLVKF